jgi:hypothetical protein
VDYGNDGDAVGNPDVRAVGNRDGYHGQRRAWRLIMFCKTRGVLPD